jgi:hypothetical protein
MKMTASADDESTRSFLLLILIEVYFPQGQDLDLFNDAAIAALLCFVNAFTVSSLKLLVL